MWDLPGGLVTKSCPTLATPWTVPRQASLSMGFCFPCSSVGKESTCNAGVCLQCRRPAFDSWIQKIPWRRKWQPIQYSFLENLMDRGDLSGSGIKLVSPVLACGFFTTRLPGKPRGLSSVLTFPSIYLSTTLGQSGYTALTNCSSWPPLPPTTLPEGWLCFPLPLGSSSCCVDVYAQVHPTWSLIY